MFFTPLYRHHGNNLQRKERTARIRQFERLFNVKAKVIATREPRQLLKSGFSRMRKVKRQTMFPGAPAGSASTWFSTTL